MRSSAPRCAAAQRDRLQLRQRDRRILWPPGRYGDLAATTPDRHLHRAGDGPAGPCGTKEAILLSRAYVDAIQDAGGVAAHAPAGPVGGRAPRRAARLPRRPRARRRRGHRPRPYGARRHPQAPSRRAPSATRRRDRRWRRRGAGARPAGARHLPRDAADQRRARRDADPAPARRRRPLRPPPLTSAPSTTPTTTCGWRRARSRPRRAGSCVHTTKSHHHQAVDRLGEGVVATGWSVLDDLVEAIEVPDARWALGVQWHPEVDPRRPRVRRPRSSAERGAAARRPRRRVARGLRPTRAAYRPPAVRRAPLDRHPRGRLHGARRRPGGAAAPPPAPPPAPRRHRRRRARTVRAVRPVPALARARRRRLRAADVGLRRRRTRCPTTTPRRSSGACASTYPVRSDRLLGARHHADAAPAARARHARAASRVWEKAARLVALAVVRVPARHRRSTCCCAHRDRSRPARRGSTPRSTSGVIGYWAIPTAPPWYAARRGLMEDGRTPELRRMMVEYGEQFWSAGWAPLYGVLGGNPLAAMPSLHFATSVTAAHVLSRDGPRRRRRSAGPTPRTLGLALVYLGEHYVVDLAAGLALAEGDPRARRRWRAPALARVSAAVQRAGGAGARHDATALGADGAGRPGAARGRGRPRRAAGAPAHAAATCSRCRGFLAASIAALYFLLPQLAGLDDTWQRIEERPAGLDRRRVRADLRHVRRLRRDVPRHLRAACRRASAGARATRSRWPALAASRLFAAGGAGGLVLTAWALRRAGIARARGRRQDDRVPRPHLLPVRASRS